MSQAKALARQLHEAKTPAEVKAAEARLERHVREREKQGYDPIQVRAAIKAWLTRLAAWERKDRG